MDLDPRSHVTGVDSDDANPFESQEPWVYATSSQDRPVRALDRNDTRTLLEARRSLQGFLAGNGSAAAAELEALDCDHHQAAQALRAARELVRERAAAWRLRLWTAELLHALGKHVECGEELRLAVESGPEGPLSTHRFARLERRRGNLERARAHALRLREHRPDSPRAQLEFGHVAQALGEKDEARECFTRAARHAGRDEILLRELDRAAPGLLAPASTLGPVTLAGRCAIVVPGHLRRLEASFTLLQELSTHCDLFVCTNAEYREAAQELAGETGATCRIVEDVPEDRRLEEDSELGSMKQWLKLGLCLGMVQERENRGGFVYDEIYKLRTDYYFLNAGALLDSAADGPARGLFARSDKVFGGSRELVLPLADLYGAMRTQFLDRERAWWPIRTGQILRSSDSYKWFGMNFPTRVVGRCRTVQALRRSVENRRDELERYAPRRFDRYTRLFQGHPRMASEVSFARFLNALDTPVRESPRLAGFLLSDRLAS